MLSTEMNGDVFLRVPVAKSAAIKTTKYKEKLPGKKEWTDDSSKKSRADNCGEMKSGLEITHQCSKQLLLVRRLPDSSLQQV